MYYIYVVLHKICSMLWTLRYTYILYIYHRPSHPSFIPIQWSESNLIFSSPSAILPLPSQECSETEDHVTVQISKHLCRYLDISVCRCIQVLWLVSVSMYVDVCPSLYINNYLRLLDASKCSGQCLLPQLPRPASRLQDKPGK